MLNLTTNTCVDLARSSARHGAGLYESIRIRHGRALRLEEHLARLAHGAAFLGLEAPPDLDEVETFLDRRTDCACLASGLLRLLAVDEALMVSACPWEPSHPTRIDIALAGRICRRAAHPLNRFKTLACLENLLLRREADDRALFEVIALNEAGRLTDGSRMSLFLVQGEVVLTPAVQDGAFSGDRPREPAPGWTRPGSVPG